MDENEDERVIPRLVASVLLSAIPGNANASQPFHLNTIRKFPTNRRPTQREMSTESPEVIHSWVQQNGITIGTLATTPDEISRAERLLYTWKDCFAIHVREIQPTDLIEHSIDVKPGSRPIKSKLPLYAPRERALLTISSPN